MASSISQTAICSIILLLALHQACSGAFGKEDTHLHFYLHQISGANGTVLEVVNPSNSSSYSFGSILVVDDTLKEGQDENSTLIGRVQGLNVVVGKEDNALETMLNFIFTEGMYNGSTLAIYGTFNLGTTVERPVIGGTGLFRMTTGYSIATPVVSTATEFVYEFDVYVWHY